MEETRRIMEESERDGTNPDERLREVVERAVRDGYAFGGQVGDEVSGHVNGNGAGSPTEDERKRSRNEHQNGGI
jgi:hypothetical protein